jgi:hypothetical protein
VQQAPGSRKFFCIIGFALLVSCKTSPDDDIVIEFDGEAFERERAAWEAGGLKDYQFEQRYDTYMPGPLVRITVRGGAVSDTELADPDPWYAENQAAEGDWWWYLNGKENSTISCFYDHIAETYQEYREIRDSGKYPKMRACIEVEYDPEYHIPLYVRLFLDELNDPEMIGSFDRYLAITGFKPLPVEEGN